MSNEKTVISALNQSFNLGFTNKNGYITFLAGVPKEDWQDFKQICVQNGLMSPDINDRLQKGIPENMLTSDTTAGILRDLKELKNKRANIESLIESLEQSFKVRFVRKDGNVRFQVQPNEQTRKIFYDMCEASGLKSNLRDYHIPESMLTSNIIGKIKNNLPNLKAPQDAAKDELVQNAIDCISKATGLPFALHEGYVQCEKEPSPIQKVLFKWLCQRSNVLLDSQDLLHMRVAESELTPQIAGDIKSLVHQDEQRASKLQNYCEILSQKMGIEFTYSDKYKTLVGDNPAKLEEGQRIHKPEQNLRNNILNYFREREFIDVLSLPSENSIIVPKINASLSELKTLPDFSTHISECKDGKSLSFKGRR